MQMIHQDHLTFALAGATSAFTISKKLQESFLRRCDALQACVGPGWPSQSGNRFGSNTKFSAKATPSAFQNIP